MSSISNNTNIPLPAGGIFNGIYEQLSESVQSIQVNIKSDVSGTFRVFFGITPLVLLYEKTFTYTPTSQYFFVSLSKKSKYFRVEYTNNPTTQQGYFQLRTTYNGYLNIEEPSGSGLALESTLLEVKTNTAIISNSPVHLDLDTQGTQIWSDSTLPWTATTNGENGWQYQNTTVGGAQCYFYANAPVLVSGSQEPDITLGSVNTMYFVGNHRLLIDNDPNHKFYLSIYTQPTGSGDAEFWYHSRKVYQLSQTQIISKGADYLFYTLANPSEIRKDLEHIELVLATQSGQCNPSEIVQFMAVNVDSQVPQNQFDGVLKEAGYRTSTTTREVIFDNSINRKAELALSKLSVEMGAVYVQNAIGSQLEVRKPSATTFTLYTGAISGSTLGNLDLDGYSSFDLLVYIPGNACSSAGSLYINISDNGTQWYTSSNSVYINVDSNPRYYTVSFPSLNCRFVSVTGNNPYGGSATATTDSTIKVSAKK